MQPRRIGFPVAALSTAYVAAGAVANLSPNESRALFSLCLITMLSMIASAFFKMQPRKMITAIGCGDGAVDVRDLLLAPAARSDGGVGPVPPSLEPLAFVVLGVINIVAAAIDRSGFFSEPPSVSISVDCVWCDGNGVVRLLRDGVQAG